MQIMNTRRLLVLRDSYHSHFTPSLAPLPLKRRRDTPPHPAMTSCTLSGHLDAPHHLRAILTNMFSDPALAPLCDVVLIVRGERFSAHRAVLAAVSPVFKAMFTNSMKEQRQTEIVLSALDPNVWRMAMHYIYHAQLDLHDESTALLLLATARMYQLEPLVDFLENFLVSRVAVTNCFRLLEEAERYDLESLQGACYSTMEQEFEPVAVSPAFLKCPHFVLIKLIGSGALVVKSEMFVFDTIIRWTVGCPEEEPQRLLQLENLLNLVRLDRLSHTELREVAANPVIMHRSRRFRTVVVERVMARVDVTTDRIMASRCHLKARRRDSRSFTFHHVQRGMTRVPGADEEEVMRTPWARDEEGKFLWRLKIYPRGYSKAKGQYLSMYVQGRSANKKERFDIAAHFDIFLMNRKDQALTISFSSEHHFRENSDHWGFHRFLQLSALHSPSNGFLEDDTDSVIVGANLYFV